MPLGKEKTCFFLFREKHDFAFCDRHGFASTRGTVVPLGNQKKMCFLFYSARSAAVPLENGKSAFFSSTRGTILKI